MARDWAGVPAGRPGSPAPRYRPEVSPTEQPDPAAAVDQPPNEGFHLLDIGGIDLVSVPAVIVGPVVRHDTYADGLRVTGVVGRCRDAEHKVGINLVASCCRDLVAASRHATRCRDRSGRRRDWAAKYEQPLRQPLICDVCPHANQRNFRPEGSPGCAEQEHRVRIPPRPHRKGRLKDPMPGTITTSWRRTQDAVRNASTPFPSTLSAIAVTPDACCSYFRYQSSGMASMPYGFSASPAPCTWRPGWRRDDQH